MQWNMATARDITIKITCVINYFWRVRVEYLPSKKKKGFVAAQHNLNTEHRNSGFSVRRSCYNLCWGKRKKSPAESGAPREGSCHVLHQIITTVACTVSLLPSVITLEVTFRVFLGSILVRCLFTTFTHPRAPAAVNCRLHALLLRPPRRRWRHCHQSEDTGNIIICAIHCCSDTFCSRRSLFFPELTLPLVFERIHGVSVEAYGLTRSKQRSTLIHPSGVGSTRPSRSEPHVLLDRQVHTAW